jgi:hypothetical protein
MKNTSGYRTFLNGTTQLSRGQRVTLSSGVLALAGATNGSAIGTLEGDIDANVYGSVRLNGTNGTAEVIANGAISVGGAIFPAASGKVSPTSVSSNTAIGIAVEAASADGDIIEALLFAPAQS